MECTYLLADESPCGDEATSYMNIPLCETHTEAMRSLMYSRSRTAALQASNYHPLESFPGFCYFALLPDGSVKIGYSNTEETLAKRLKNLTSDYKAPVIKLATMPGGFVAEAVIHEKFKSSRIPGTGERFNYSAEMAEFIASL